MLETLMKSAIKELETRITNRAVTSENTDSHVTEIAKSLLPSDPTEILKIVADDYRLLTYEPVDDNELRAEKTLTPIVVIQYLIQEALEDGLWLVVDKHFPDEEDDG